MSEDLLEEDDRTVDRRRGGVMNRIRRFVSTNPQGSKRKIDIDPDIFMAVLFIGLVMLGCLVAITLYQQGRMTDQQNALSRAQAQVHANQDDIRTQQQQLAKLEKRDRVSSLQTAYRFCSRESIDRAAVHWFLSRRLIRSLPEQIAREARKQGRSDLKRMERKDGMPILDCTPNLVGDPAVYLSPSDQRKFVERWRRHMLTPAEIGICRVRIGELKAPGDCLN